MEDYMNELIIEQISKDLNIKTKQVESVLKLLQEGNTIPLLLDIEKK